MSTISYLKIVIVFLFLSSFYTTKAAHIFGGDLNVECLDNNQYKISLQMYRDCLGSGAGFDEPLYLGIYEEGSTDILQTLAITPNSQLDTLIEACGVDTGQFCIEVATYDTIISLPVSQQGYHFSYQRCCWSTAVDNINMPEEVGMTLSAYLSPESLQSCNKMPKLNQRSPIYICVNEELNWDHSATDVDGDSIVYSLCTPFDFEPISQMDYDDLDIPGTPNRPSNPAPPPYDGVPFQVGYDAQNMLGTSSNPLVIDPGTGLLSGTPTIIGQFLVGICIEEYRNGQLISSMNINELYIAYQCNENSVNAPCDDELEYTINDMIVMDGDNCDCVGTIPPLEVTMIESINPTCEIANGEATVNHAGGKPPYIYLWSNGQTTPTITSLSPGMYVVTVTDADGTTATNSVQLENVGTIPEADFNFQIEGLSVTFENLSSGSEPLVFNWDFDDGSSSGNPNPMHTFEEAGIYKVALIASNDCETLSTFCQNIVVFEPLEVTTNGEDPTCELANGATTTSLTGGIPPYTYFWSNGQNTENLTDLLSGNYSVTITDSNGTTATSSVQLENIGTIPEAGFNFQADGLSVTFENLSTGSDLLFNWGFDDGGLNSQETNPMYTFAAAGTYKVALTVSNNCETPSTFCQTIMVAEPCSSLSGQTNITEATCNTMNGAIDIVASGGNPPYQFDIGNGQQSTSTFSDLSAGAYNITVTDTQGCIAIIPATIENTVIPPTADFEANSDDLVAGFTNVSSGTAPLTYLWTFGDGNDESSTETNPIYTYANPGTYEVCLEVTNDCSTSVRCRPVNINIDCDISISETIENATCGNDDGFITVSVSGGSGFYSYNWGDNALSGASIQELGAGLYQVIVTDETTGCAIDKVFLLEAIMPPTASILTPLQLTCDNDEVTLDASNSIGIGNDLAYQWLSPNNAIFSTDAITTASQAGVYQLVIEDSNECVDSVEITVISNLTNPIAEVGESQTLTCSQQQIVLGESTSSIGANFTHTWTGPDGFSQLEVYPTITTPGVYTLEVLDNTNGCAVQSSVTILQNIEPPIVSIAEPEDLNCVNMSIQLDASQSAQGANFEYTWTGTNGFVPTSDLNPTITQAGLYTLVVENTENNCLSSSAVLIEENTDMPTANAGEPQVLTCLQTSVTLGSNGTSQGVDFEYIWTGPDSFSGDTRYITVEEPGTYFLTVIHTENGCEDQSMVTVDEIIGNLEMEITTTMSACELETGSITVSATGGVAPLIYTIDGFLNNIGVFNDYGAGSYIIQAGDANGCIVEQIVTIDNFPSPIIDLGADVNDVCTGEAVTLDLTNPNSSFSYDWSTGENSTTIDVTEPNTYLLTVTDGNNCTGEDAINVDFIPELILELGSSSNEPVCPNTAVELSVLNTNADEVQWIDNLNTLNPAVDNMTAIVDPSITTTYTISGENMCFDTLVQVTVDIFEPEEIALVDSVIISVGATENLLVQGGQSYEWIIPDSLMLSCTDCPDPSLSALTTGEFNLQLMLTDTNNCETTQEILVIADATKDSVFPVNIITPNGDGENDFLVFKELPCFTSNSLQIMNRWGNIVYEMTDYQNDWNGVYSGKDLPAGTYYYILKVEEIELVLKSTLMILR